jgi:hypothetical protein
MTLSLVLAATIALGPEITSVPFTPTARQDDCSAAALAQTSEGTFLAWPMVSEGREGMMAVLLDSTFHVIPGKTVFLPRPTTPVCPSAASDGSTVVLVWAAPATTTTSSLEGARFHSNLELIDGPVVFYPRAPLGSRPGIAWMPSAGGTFLLAAGEFWLELGSSTPLAGLRWFDIHGWVDHYAVWTFAYDAVAPAKSGFALSARAFAVPRPPGSCWGPCPQTYWVSVGTSHPHWLWPWEISTEPGTDPAATTIACLGDECLVSWVRNGVMAKWLRAPVAERQLTIGWTPGVAPIASAADEESILIVWENHRKTVVGAEGKLSGVGKQFTIAEGPESRTGPSILKLGPGRFLVAYRITDGTTTRIGGRVVNLDSPPRRRIAR